MAAWTKFESDEVGRYLAEARARERAPLADRKDAQREFFDAMKNHPDVVGERVGWLLNGSYGQGAGLKASQILESPRMNRQAALTILVGDAEWMTPAAMAVAAWKKLTPSQKAALAREVEQAIRAREAEVKREREYEASRDPRRRNKTSSTARKKHPRGHRTPGAPTFAKQAQISRKIRKLRHEGYGPKQAEAIAYRMAGVPPKKKRSRDPDGRYTVTESKVWVRDDGRTASPYGAVPWVTAGEKDRWKLVKRGYTVQDNVRGTIGIGRVPWSTRAEAQAWADKENARLAEIRARLSSAPISTVARKKTRASVTRRRT